MNQSLDDLEKDIASAMDEMKPKPSDEELAEFKNQGRADFAKGLPREAPRAYTAANRWPHHAEAWYAGYDAARDAYYLPVPWKDNEQIDKRVNAVLAKNKDKRKKPRERVARAERISAAITPKVTEEHSGGSVSYYVIDILHPTHDRAPYTVECNDIIEALEMDYAEGNVFKAIWRTAAARQGKLKKGHDAKYDAEKIIFFGKRLLERAVRYLKG